MQFDCGGDPVGDLRTPTLCIINDGHAIISKGKSHFFNLRLYICILGKKTEQIIPKGRAIFNLRLHILGIGLTHIINTYEEEIL